MSAGAVALSLPTRRAINPWVIALAVVIPTFMEVLDTTIANVALRYIAGGLSAPTTDSEWVITSYLAANAIILPISGWLGTRLGRRNYFLLSIGIFTLASALCGMATSLGELIIFRVIQGLAGGGLQPSSQGVLLDAFPPEKQGAAQTLFGLAALLAPVVGPTLGGYITDNYGWRWIFFLNVPVGILALLMCNALVFDPDYLKAQQADMRKQGRPFDTLGLVLLAVTMVSWEILLSKGQEWDWFGDPFYRIRILATLFVCGLGGLIVREMRIANPLIHFRTLKDRNFRSCCIIIFCAYGVLYANTTQLPALLQSLFGYDATTSGLVLSPSGISAILALIIVGILLQRGVDARYLMAAGLLVLGIGNFWFSRLNLEISPWQVIWPRVVLVGGLSMIFAPLNVAAFLYIPKEMRGAAVGLLALLRNEGGSVGTSAAQTILERREQFHALRLNENLDPLNQAVRDLLNQGNSFFLQNTGDAVASQQMSLQIMENQRQQQALSLSYFDVFWTSAAIAFVLIFLVLLMRRSVAEKARTLEPNNRQSGGRSMEAPLSTRQKALALNLDARTYGTFAEIGAGQEVVRWFFAVGGAAGSVAKTISAYDMAVSDGLYGHATRYVGRQRLEAMLEQEFIQLLSMLMKQRGENKRFFVFADTVATRSFNKTEKGRGWLGIRFQTQPGEAPSQVILHAHLLESTAAREQEAVGILGVNLIHAAFYRREDPCAFIQSLMDDLSRERIEIDMIKLSGPAFAAVDNRLMSLQLVERGFTGAAMFMSDGEVVQPSELLYKKTILVERGSFRPATKLTIDLLQQAREQFLQEPSVQGKEPVVIAEMTLRSLIPGPEVGHEDFIARAEILHALGFNVLISRFEQHYQMAEYLAAYTDQLIGIAAGLRSVRQQVADEQYYTELPGGVLESVGRLFKRSVKMYIYPTRDPVTGEVRTLENEVIPAPWHHLRNLLRDAGRIVPIRRYDETLLSIRTPEVLAQIESGDASWEAKVPSAVANIIKSNRLFQRTPKP